MVIDNENSSREVVTVSSGVGTSLTVIRGADGTVATSHSAGATVDHAIVARDLAEPQSHIAASTNVHGIGGGSSVVGTADSQVLTNKTLTSPIINTPTMSGGTVTLNNATTATLKGSFLTLQDDSDTTKQAQFNMSGITTATTRTYTLPNASSTLADLSTAQVLTNKTLTSPSISNPTITGTATVSSLTVNSVNYDPLGAAWTTWSPTLTNLTLGNGTVTARYRQVGKTVDYRFKFKLGSTSAVGTAPAFTLPVAPHASYTGDEDLMGIGRLLDVGTLSYDAIVRLQGGSTVDFSAVGTAGANGTGTGVTATVPFTWGTGDTLSAMGTYEAA